MWGAMALTLTAAFSVAAVMTLVSMQVSKRLHILDEPNSIKIHSEPIPRLGGMGIFAGLAVAVAMSDSLDTNMHSTIRAAVIGAIPIFVTGTLDDCWGLRPVEKLSGQALGAIVYCWLSGVWRATSLIGSGIRTGAVVIVITGLANSFNLTDGMNGLLAGISSVLFAGGAAIAAFSDMTAVSTVLLGATGACLGFLPHNFPRARTFMGDSGSLLLGAVAAMFLIELGLRHGLVSAPVLGWVTALSVPISDTALAITRRIRRGGNVLEGDRDHLYDRIARLLGGDATTAVVIMWCLAALTLCGGIVVSRHTSVAGALTIVIATYSVVVLIGSLLGCAGK